MKRIVHDKTITFRLPLSLKADLAALADTVGRHESDLIRDSLAQFVGYFRQCPDQLKRWGTR